MDHEKMKVKQHKNAGQLISGRKGRKSATEDTSKKKLRWFYILVDSLLLLFLAFCICLIVSIWVPVPDELLGEAEPCSIQYTVEIQDMRPEFLSAIAKGDTVISFTTGEALGIVDDVVIRTDAQDGSKQQRTLVLTLTADARYREGRGYFIGDLRIVAGGEIEMLFENIYSKARCVECVVKE